MKKLIFLSLFLFAAQLHSEDMYWVGGSGYWHEFFKHWSNKPGGTFYMDRVPGPDDNVIFDENSFPPGVDSIHITIKEHALCRNLDFSRCTKKVFLQKEDEPSFRMFGSLILNQNISIDINLINFEGENEPFFIQTDGIKLEHLIFLSGDYELRDNLFCDNFFSNGNIFSTNNNDMDVRYFNANCNELYLGNATINVRTGGFYVNSGISLFDAGNSNIIIQAPNQTFNAGEQTFHNVLFENKSGAGNISGGGNINVLEFRGNGKINSSFSCGNLILSPGSYYYLHDNINVNIGNTFDAVGNCRENIYIYSDKENPGTINKNSGNVECDYVLLENIHAGGGANFIATNSTDLGGVNGWQITGPVPKLLYWVGKEGGYWDDPANWSETSGGPGGACLPTPFNDVYFDQNSFAGDAEVITNTPLLFCRNMYWRNTTGNPVFKNQSKDPFRIYGSLELDDNMDTQLSNTFLFYGSGSNYIQSSFNKLGHVNIKSGDYVLMDKLYCNNFYSYGEIFKTNSHNMDVRYFNANCDEIYLGSSTIRVSTNGFYAHTDISILDAGTSNIIIQAPNQTFSANGHLFHNVLFESESGMGRLEWEGRFNKVEFRGNGQLSTGFDFNTLIFSPGYYYIINSNSEININDSFDAVGNCRENIYIYSDKENPGTINKNSGNVECDYVLLENIHAGGGANFIATNSTDLGGVNGWQITGPVPKLLYWVGKEGGYWDDPANWSETSGGPGGACLPTPFNDVYFDQNSFAGDAEVITNTPLLFCRNMYWRNTTGNPVFKNQSKDPFRIYGSLELDDNMDTQLSNTFLFYGSGSNYIQSSFNKLGHVNIKSGDYELMDKLYCDNFYSYGEIFKTNSHNMDVRYFNANCDEIYLGSSTIRVSTNGFYAHTDISILDAGTSNIIIQAPNQTFSANGHLFHNVLFESESGTGRIDYKGKFNKVEFFSNGSINKNNEFDTLRVTAGNIYQLEANKIQRINEYFHAKGNSCFPVFLKSSSRDTPADIFKERDTVICDFLELNGIRATGGGVFYAGSFTDTLGTNNTGWIFSNAPGYIYGLGPDTVLCRGTLLETMNFNGGKSFLWHDGSTEPYHTVDEPGLYWVEVTYADSCIFRDSVNIDIVSNAMVSLGNDILVCEPDTEVDIEVEINSGIAPYEIYWQPYYISHDINQRNIKLSFPDSKEIVVKVKSKNGCFAYDTLQYIVLDKYQPNISRQGDYLVSSSKTGNQWYLNSEIIPGATGQYYLPFENGIYSVRVIDENGCKSAASKDYQFQKSFAKGVLKIGDGEAYIGDEVKIPVYLYHGDKINSNTEKISGNISVNSSILYPLPPYYTLNSKNGKRNISFEFNYDSSELLGYLNFKAALGNSEYSLIEPDLMSMNLDTAEIEVFPGSFKLLGICREGGARLVNPIQTASIEQIFPVPASNKIELIYTLIESGNTKLSIKDVLGNNVLDIMDNTIKNFGKQSRLIDISKLPAGVYYIILQTPTVVQGEKFIIQ